MHACIDEEGIKKKYTQVLKKMYNKSQQNVHV